MDILKNYKFITTDDGSVTVFSELYNEACHSTSGAVHETNLHYIDGCKIVDKARDKKMTILEVGFGVGIGYEQTKKALPGFPFTFISLEIDPDLIEYYLQKNPSLELLEKKDFVYRIKDDLNELIILCGDARKTLPLYHMENDLKVDAIYQDAFSPKRNSILWTKEWFSFLKKIATDDCIMSTYSSSSSVRKSMIEGGWNLYKGAKFGPKRSSTRAILTGTTDPEILEHLNRSPVSAITDANHLEFTLEKK